MAPDSKKSYPKSLSSIFIAKGEWLNIEGFIGQYIESRGLNCEGNAHAKIVAALKNYPGIAPVRLFELNAWLDSNFRGDFFYCSSVTYLRLVVNNDFVPLSGDTLQ